MPSIGKEGPNAIAQRKADERHDYGEEGGDRRCAFEIPKLKGDSDFLKEAHTFRGLRVLDVTVSDLFGITIMWFGDTFNLIQIKAF